MGSSVMFWTSNLFLCLVLLLILPSHCPFNFCFYNSPSIVPSNTEFVNFFAMGDPQNMHFIDQKDTNLKWHNRIFATELYIDAINVFVKA